jgi:hypothetical protein
MTHMVWLLSAATKSRALPEVWCLGINGLFGPFWVLWTKTDQEIPMSFATKFDAIDALPKTPASDVKKLGWRGVMRDVQKSGRVVVTYQFGSESFMVCVLD